MTDLGLQALEVCQTLRRKLGHAKVGCKTGEEEDLPEADVLCCTAECAPEAGDTLVLDEVHWLVDEGRGHVRALCARVLLLSTPRPTPNQPRIPPRVGRGGPIRLQLWMDRAESPSSSAA